MDVSVGTYAPKGLCKLHNKIQISLATEKKRNNEVYPILFTFFHSLCDKLRNQGRQVLLDMQLNMTNLFRSVCSDFEVLFHEVLFHAQPVRRDYV